MKAEMENNVKKAIEIVKKYKELVEMTTDQVNEIVVSISDVLKDVEETDFSQFEKLFDLFIKQNLRK
jgi:hypothetical protein